MELSSAVDTPLIAVSWFTTAAFSVFAWRLRRMSSHTSPAMNLALLCHPFFILTALWVWLRVDSPVHVVGMLLERVFGGTCVRLCVLLFWMLCLAASLLFCVLVNALHIGVTTVHRKFFHLTISLVAISGLLYEPKLVALAAHLMLQLFIILETLRSLGVSPWAPMLNEYCVVFLDEQDSTELVLTPIYLHLGVFLPILLSSFSPASIIQPTHLRPFYFSGVMSVGVGDSFAALVGSYLGRTKWPSTPGSGKTIEGSMAMLLSQLLFIPLVLGTSAFNAVLLLAAVATTLVEAHVRTCDNVLLPIVAASLFYVFGY